MLTKELQLLGDEVNHTLYHGSAPEHRWMTSVFQTLCYVPPTMETDLHLWR